MAVALVYTHTHTGRATSRLRVTLMPRKHFSAADFFLTMTREEARRKVIPPGNIVYIYNTVGRIEKINKHIIQQHTSHFRSNYLSDLYIQIS